MNIIILYFLHMSFHGYHFGTMIYTSFSTFRFYKKKAFIFGMEIKNASREYLDRYGSTLFEKEWILVFLILVL